MGFASGARINLKRRRPNDVTGTLLVRHYPLEPGGVGAGNRFDATQFPAGQLELTPLVGEKVFWSTETLPRVR
jgi:hypothetical protein